MTHKLDVIRGAAYARSSAETGFPAASASATSHLATRGAAGADLHAHTPADIVVDVVAAEGCAVLRHGGAHHGRAPRRAVRSKAMAAVRRPCAALVSPPRWPLALLANAAAARLSTKQSVLSGRPRASQLRRWGSSALLTVGIAFMGCAHPAGPSPAAGAQHALAPPLEQTATPQLPRPTSQAEARRALELAFAAEGMGDHALCAAQLDAVLASDFLTDAGRMNVYWHAAAAHREMNNPIGERDALEGFWLTAQLVQLNDDERARADEAETLLRRLSDQPPAYVQAQPSARLVSR